MHWTQRSSVINWINFFRSLFTKSLPQWRQLLSWNQRLFHMQLWIGLFRKSMWNTRYKLPKLFLVKVQYHICEALCRNNSELNFKIFQTVACQVHVLTTEFAWLALEAHTHVSAEVDSKETYVKDQVTHYIPFSSVSASFVGFALKVLFIQNYTVLKICCFNC